VSFEKLLAKDLKPEFKPRLSKDILDVSNFDEMFTQDEAIHSVLPWSA
jgi:predicted nucleotidyltransferase component of viral defense system